MQKVTKIKTFIIKSEQRLWIIVTSECNNIPECVKLFHLAIFNNHFFGNPKQISGQSFDYKF